MEGLKIEKREQSFFERLLSALEKNHRRVVRDFRSRHKRLIAWADASGISLNQLQDQARTALSVGLVWSILSLASFQPPPASLSPLKDQAQEAKLPVGLREDFLIHLRELVKKQVKTKRDDKGQLSDLVFAYTGVRARDELSGIRLNRYIGKIGYEQHLTRYPGDRLTTHFSSAHDRLLYAKAGMAGGRGAFGYFANSRAQLTPDLVQKEKYYLVAQTFKVASWGKNTQFLKEWFKHRKMIVINPANGQAVVGVLGDAGPAEYTGRSFGGSPEVMEALGPIRGEVVMLFVDDPDDGVPLGPVELPSQPEFLSYGGRGV